MIATWLWDRKVGLMTFLDFLWWKPISEWVNDFRYLCGLDLGGEVPYEHRTWTEGACAHLSVSEESSPRSHTLSHSLSAVRLSSSLSYLQTIMEPAVLQFSTNPPRYQFCISSFYHHNPFSFLKSFTCKLTQYFCVPVPGHFSVPEDSGQWDNPAVLSSCAVWQSSLQPAASCSVPSGYDHCRPRLGAKPFLVPTEHIQNVTVKSQKWTLTTRQGFI